MFFQTFSCKQNENQTKIELAVILGIKFVVVGIYVKKNPKFLHPPGRGRGGDFGNFDGRTY